MRLSIISVALFALLPMPAQAQFAAPKPKPLTGDKLFGQQCGACHSTVAGETRVGPSLAGVVGRKAGRGTGFQYSAALKKSGLTWSPDMLDRWLAGSALLVPGTTMPYAQADTARRKAIIDYLTTQTAR